MASKLTFVLIAVAAAAATLPNDATATQYMVGDDKGWGKGVNYTAWAEGKEFFVGDSLVFMYKAGSHNVYKTTGPQFQACEVPKGGAALTTGNDVVPLATPGRKWYICGFDGHCAAGQKLVITVQPSALSPSPSPAPWSPAPCSPATLPPAPWPTHTAAAPAISAYSAIFFAAVAALMKALL